MTGVQTCFRSDASEVDAEAVRRVSAIVRERLARIGLVRSGPVHTPSEFMPEPPPWDLLRQRAGCAAAWLAGNIVIACGASQDWVSRADIDILSPRTGRVHGLRRPLGVPLPPCWLLSATEIGAEVWLFGGQSHEDGVQSSDIRAVRPMLPPVTSPLSDRYMADAASQSSSRYPQIDQRAECPHHTDRHHHGHQYWTTHLIPTATGKSALPRRKSHRPHR